MGCCESTHKDSKFDKGGSKYQESKSTHESRAPPPSLDQEETVKEVLSETPKLKLPPPPPEPIKNREQHHQDNHHSSKKNVHFQLSPPPPLLDEKINTQERRYKMFQEEEIFEIEASEVCSLSLSESLLTATINNNGRMDYDDCDDKEVKRRAVMKSPAPKLASRNRVYGDLGSKIDRPPPLVGKSPTRRTEQSPSRRNNAVRSVVQSGREQTGRLGLRTDPNRRETGESSGRRSRSPATNRSTTGRSPFAGKANQSPGRVRTHPPVRGGNGPKMVYSTGPTNESLENPLVSLECFIFL